MSLSPHARIRVGVVVERRKASNPWDDFLWRPVAILTGEPAAEPWTQLAATGDVTTFYAGPADIDLYRTDTAHYRDNLAAATPSLWVALRPSFGERPYELAAVTADPAEGESFTQVGNDVVEALAMPEPVREIIEAFIAEHHVERPFFKRMRDSDPDVPQRRTPMSGDEPE